MAADFLSDLAAASAPQTPQSAFLADLANAPPPATAPTSAAPQPSALRDWSGAFASAAVRPIAKGVAALPLMAMDAGVASRNLLGDAANRMLGRPATPDYTMPSTMFNQALDTFTQAPQGVGKLAEAISTGIVGARLPMPQVGQSGPIGAALGLNPGTVAPAGFVRGVSNRVPLTVPAASAGPISAPALAQAAARRQALGYSTGADVAPSVASGNLTGAQQQAAAAGQQLGMRMTPGQASGSVPLQQLEARLEASPWTSGPFGAIKSGNQAVVNRTAAQSIGETANTVDSTVLSRANERLGNVFENVRDPNQVLLTDPQATTAKLDSIDQNFAGLLPGNASIRTNPLVAQLEGLTSQGAINGQQLGQLSSKLGKAAFKEMTGPSGDRDLGQALYQVKDHVDDLVQSTLNAQDAALYGAARQQYRNLMLLTSRTNIVNPSTGNVSGAALASKLQQADKPGFLYGQNQTPLYQAARFSQAFKPLVGDSGTATRSAGHGLALPLGLALAGHLTGMPLGADAALAAAPLAGRVLGNLGTRAYLSGPGAALARGSLGLAGSLGRGSVAALRSLPRNVPVLAMPFQGQPLQQQPGGLMALPSGAPR